MDVKWVPYAAASLTVGALAVLVGALVMPAGDAAESLSIVETNDGRWLMVSALFFLGSVSMTMGLPCVFTLFRGRGARLGMIAVGIFAIGTISTAGYAMLLVFYRALVLTDSLNGPLEGVSSETGIAAFLVVFLAAFYGGELLLAIALFRARTVPRWIPAVLAAHVAMLALSRVLPSGLESFSTLLLAAGFCGIAITANELDSERRLVS